MVIVHRPGDELDRLTPGNVQGFLIEDIPYLRRMQEEHDSFCEIMAKSGVKVLILADLVADVVATPEGRERVVREACELNHNPALAQPILDHFSNDEITRVVFQGLTEQEFAATTHRSTDGLHLHHDRFLIDPSPNSYFTRDPAMVFGDEVISCNAHYNARIRETWVTHAVIDLHPSLAGTKFIFGESELESRPYTIEGGDIIVLNQDAIAVGRSERTRSETIGVLAANLFRTRKAKRVYEVEIPPERVFMHLDTVFTIVGPQSVVVFPQVVERGPTVSVYEPTTDGSKPWPKRERRSVLDILRDELNRDLNIIRTARGDLRYAAREQRSAGSNMLALAPNRVVSYERNIHTNLALRDAGVEVLEIPSSELVRGLGGPRCMSMPLRRRRSG
ncbi:MAG: arginine deiminase [bacterium]|nr:arginine deiminase [bacterium]